MEEIKKQKHSMEFQKEWKEFMTLNKMEGIKGIQWNIKLKQSINRRNKRDSIEFDEILN